MRGDIMDEEKNELNDIILNKGSGVTGNKKILLIVATLGVILIIVVMLMNSLTSRGTDNLPQAVLPPEPQAMPAAQQVQEEPLFEDVEVVQEEKKDVENLDKITKRLKEESKTEIVTPKQVAAPVKKVQEETKAQKHITATESTSSQSYFVQVGSFSKYEPDVKFLKSITDKGFKYQYYKVTKNDKDLNKVLIGPFESEKDARDALRTIRSNIESGAFLVKI
jgi:DedD protein